MCTFEHGSIVDGYRLIRVIGSGGFGDVWLCFSQTLQQYYALKVLRHDQARHGERELSAVQQFKQLGLGNAATGIMPIEHVGHVDGRLYYIMPLADGNGKSPEEPGWQPLTLDTLIRQRSESHEWFSSAEIVALFEVLIGAVEVINGAGLVHRDIKPDNILFLQGRPVLSDISLLKPDSGLLTEIGTPGYRAPSWYAESSGKPDMFGLAATLYAMLTGNAPDKIGRAAFRWPPTGEDSLTPAERAAWLRLHQVIFRATAENSSGRYLTFAAMAEALRNDQKIPLHDGAVATAKMPFRRRWIWVATACLLVVACVWLVLPPPDATLASGEIVSGKDPWQKCDTILDSIESKFQEYQSQWSDTKGAANQILNKLKEEPPSLDVIEASAKSLLPLAAEVKQLRKALEERQQVFWGGVDIPGSYCSAIVVDYSEDGLRQRDLREGRNVKLMNAWYDLYGDLAQVPQISWSNSVYKLYDAELSANQKRLSDKMGAALKQAQAIFKDGSPNARERGEAFLAAADRAAEEEYKLTEEKLNRIQKELDALQKY